MLLADLTPLLADSLSDPKSSEATGWLFVAIGGLAVTCNQLLSLVSNFRKLRDPSSQDSETEAKIAGLRREIHDVELRMEKRMGENLGEIKTRMQTLESTLTHVVADINFALGKMAAAAETKSPQ